MTRPTTHRHAYKAASDGYDPQYVEGHCACGDVQIFSRRDQFASPVLAVTVHDESGSLIRRIARVEAVSGS